MIAGNATSPTCCMHTCSQLNRATVPFLSLQIYAFLAEHYSRPLARVLFWAGAGPLMLINVIIVGEWLATIRHEGHVNGSFQMGPVGNLIVAIVSCVNSHKRRPHTQTLLCHRFICDPVLLFASQLMIKHTCFGAHADWTHC